MNQELETVVESHEAFLSRRSMAMAGMIGSLSARLGIIKDELKSCYTYKHANEAFLKQQMQSMHKDIVEGLLKYHQEWADMQNYDEEDAGKSYSDKDIVALTTELETLKTLAL
jgi:hypothetical protein